MRPPRRADGERPSAASLLARARAGQRRCRRPPRRARRRAVGPVSWSAPLQRERRRARRGATRRGEDASPRLAASSALMVRARPARVSGASFAVGSAARPRARRASRGGGAARPPSRWWRSLRVAWPSRLSRARARAQEGRAAARGLAVAGFFVCPAARRARASFRRRRQPPYAAGGAARLVSRRRRAVRDPATWSRRRSRERLRGRAMARRGLRRARALGRHSQARGVEAPRAARPHETSPFCRWRQGGAPPLRRALALKSASTRAPVSRPTARARPLCVCAIACAWGSALVPPNVCVCGSFCRARARRASRPQRSRRPLRRAARRPREHRARRHRCRARARGARDVRDASCTRYLVLMKASSPPPDLEVLERLMMSSPRFFRRCWP